MSEWHIRPERLEAESEHAIVFYRASEAGAQVYIVTPKVAMDEAGAASVAADAERAVTQAMPRLIAHRSN